MKSNTLRELNVYYQVQLVKQSYSRYFRNKGFNTGLITCMNVGKPRGTKIREVPAKKSRSGM